MLFKAMGLHVITQGGSVAIEEKRCEDKALGWRRQRDDTVGKVFQGEDGAQGQTLLVVQV